MTHQIEAFPLESWDRRLFLSQLWELFLRIVQDDTAKWKQYEVFNLPFMLSSPLDLLFRETPVQPRNFRDEDPIRGCLESPEI